MKIDAIRSINYKKIIVYGANNAFWRQTTSYAPSEENAMQTIKTIWSFIRESVAKTVEARMRLNRLALL